MGHNQTRVRHPVRSAPPHSLAPCLAADATRHPQSSHAPQASGASLGTCTEGAARQQLAPPPASVFACGCHWLVTVIFVFVLEVHSATHM